jgi:hypothetical protein
MRLEAAVDLSFTACMLPAKKFNPVNEMAAAGTF